MKHRLERWYAFSVFLLRDFFKLSPFDGLYNWKASTTIVASECFLAFAAVLTLSVAARWDALLRSRAALSFSAVVLFNIFYFAHVTAEKRLLHRFEGEFHHLPRGKRVASTVMVLALVVLSLAAVIAAATAARNRLASTGV